MPRKKSEKAGYLPKNILAIEDLFKVPEKFNYNNKNTKVMELQINENNTAIDATYENLSKIYKLILGKDTAGFYGDFLIGIELLEDVIKIKLNDPQEQFITPELALKHFQKLSIHKKVIIDYDLFFSKKENFINLSFNANSIYFENACTIMSCKSLHSAINNRIKLRQKKDKNFPIKSVKSQKGIFEICFREDFCNQFKETPAPEEMLQKFVDLIARRNKTNLPQHLLGQLTDANNPYYEEYNRDNNIKFRYRDPESNKFLCIKDENGHYRYLLKYLAGDYEKALLVNNGQEVATRSQQRWANKKSEPKKLAQQEKEFANDSADEFPENDFESTKTRKNSKKRKRADSDSEFKPEPRRKKLPKITKEISDEEKNLDMEDAINAYDEEKNLLSDFLEKTKLLGNNFFSDEEESLLYTNIPADWDKVFPHNDNKKESEIFVRKEEFSPHYEEEFTIDAYLPVSSSNLEFYADNTLFLQAEAANVLAINHLSHFAVTHLFKAVHDADVYALKHYLTNEAASINLYAYQIQTDGVSQGTAADVLITPLMYACILGNEEIIKNLLNAEFCNVNICSLFNGYNALFYLLLGNASEEVKNSLIKDFIRKEIDLNHTDLNDRKAFEYTNAGIKPLYPLSYSSNFSFFSRESNNNHDNYQENSDRLQMNKKN